MKDMTCYVNGIEVTVPEGTSIFNAAKEANTKIPALCYHPDLPAWAACGICVVKLENSPKMVRACAAEVTEGMKIITHDSELHQVRKTVIELILSTHPNSCLTCPRNQNCELQQLAAEFGIREIPYEMNIPEIEKDTSTPSIVLDPEKCVKCGRCVNVCQHVQNVWALEFIGRGDETQMKPAGDIALNETPCIKCGQCSAHCPVGAIYEKDDTREVIRTLRNGKQTSVVQVAPAVRVALGEAFGFEPGEISTGKLYAALRRLGFDVVFDTNFAADLTIMEEASEFVKRFVKGEGKIPMITTCCPSWVDYMEKYYPETIPNFSTAKSPQMMMGAMVKSYYAEQIDKTPEEIFHVSIMPCTSKKYEITRDEHMYSTGQKDVDVVITTRELARMIKSAGIDFAQLEDEEADPALGIYSGAGTIFGVTGGVMEAAVRSAYNFVTGKNMDRVEFEPVRGLDGVKEAVVDIEGTEVRVAVAHQMGNAAEVMNRIKAAEEAGEEPPWHFIEIMACRGGCIGGGGQPYGATDEVRAKRIAGLYSDDQKSVARCSHDNPQIKAIYEKFLGEPLGEKSHQYLHTHYTERKLYQR
ncbi:MAG: NADH-dependent [FeFe] hydrogenase, group A6 [Spirochaeta sp.]|jgi:iron-only hydrogenase group A|nr:NADH-dependent [FeFe] hydrogenase, group A6 [Spirochaeta sp.]